MRRLIATITYCLLISQLCSNEITKPIFEQWDFVAIIEGSDDDVLVTLIKDKNGLCKNEENMKLVHKSLLDLFKRQNNKSFLYSRVTIDTKDHVRIKLLDKVFIEQFKEAIKPFRVSPDFYQSQKQQMMK